MVLWTSNEPAQMNTFETSGVRISDRDVNSHYMCLSSLFLYWKKICWIGFSWESGKCQVIVLLNYSSDLKSGCSSTMHGCLREVLCLATPYYQLDYFGEPAAGSLVSCDLFISAGKRGCKVCSTTYPTCLRIGADTFYSIKMST